MRRNSELVCRRPRTAGSNIRFNSKVHGQQQGLSGTLLGIDSYMDRVSGRQNDVRLSYFLFDLKRHFFDMLVTAIRHPGCLP
jgi:hypothetical protein